MSPGRLPAIDHSTLSLGRQLGQGGQGAVFEVPHKKINEATDSGGWDVVYKEYAPAVLPHLDAAALTSQVGLLGELSVAEGRWLCEKTAWPAAMVGRGEHACGFLMRAVPDRFRFTYKSLAGTAPGTKRLANMEYLLNDDSYVAGVGLSISDRDRLLLLADLAATLTRLHRIGITVGDLSPKNLLFTTAPRPECFLIDCDSMRLRGATVLPQAETPDWQVPAGEEKATRASDVYKLALLAVRLLARHQTATDPAALAAACPPLGDLARASLNPDPAHRPTPAAWAEQLTAAASSASTTPATTPPTRPKPAKTVPPPTGPAAGPLHSPVGNQANVNWWALKGMAVAAALMVIVIALVVTHSHHDSSSGSKTSPQPTNSQDDTGSTSQDPSYHSSGSDGGDGGSSGGGETSDDTPSPSPTDTATPSPTDTFDPADLDSSSTDQTPLSAGALLPDSFTDSRGVHYTRKGSGPGPCISSSDRDDVSSALDEANCTREVNGTYIDDEGHILVSVQVMPVSDSATAKTAYHQLLAAHTQDWGIYCPQSGTGSTVCDSNADTQDATQSGTIGLEHRYLLQATAIYISLGNDPSDKPWTDTAAREAVRAAGPMNYSGNQ